MFLELAGSSNGVHQTKLTDHSLQTANDPHRANNNQVNDPQASNSAHLSHDGNLPVNGDPGPMHILRPVFSDATSQQYSTPDHNISPIDPDLQDPVRLLACVRDLQQKLESTTRELHNAKQRSPKNTIAGFENVIDNANDPIRQSPMPQINIRRSQWNNEIKRWKRVTSPYGTTKIYKASERIEDVRARSSGYVLTVYDEYDHEGNRTHVSLEINSAPLLELLRRVITYYPGDEFDTLRGLEATGDAVTFTDPSMILFTYRKQLQKSLDDDHPENAKEHLKMLLDFMRIEHPKFSSKLQEIEEGRCQKIGFNYLWLLYPPNTPVYVGKGGIDRQMVVYSRVSSINQKGLSVPLKLQCWDVDYEQKVFKRIFSTWIIEPFLGEKNLEDLDLVPQHYMPNAADLRSKLIARGRRYYELNKTVCLQEYFGDEFPRGFKDEPVRVVVDEETYWRKNPARYSKDDLPSQDFGFPEGEEALVDETGQPFHNTFARCFPRVGVYSMRDKCWSLVKVDDLRPVDFREKAFKRLVIKEEYKKMIKAMVQAYMLEQPGFSDLVSGKGRGLTVLIHGPPGTGKTLTAECIAEHQKRPL